MPLSSSGTMAALLEVAGFGFSSVWSEEGTRWTPGAVPGAWLGLPFVFVPIIAAKAPLRSCSIDLARRGGATTLLLLIGRRRRTGDTDCRLLPADDDNGGGGDTDGVRRPDLLRLLLDDDGGLYVRLDLCGLSISTVVLSMT